eukprot:scaffold616359_cov15-Prasinocladus_malaysianus.AAC.1
MKLCTSTIPHSRTCDLSFIMVEGSVGTRTVAENALIALKSRDIFTWGRELAVATIWSVDVTSISAFWPSMVNRQSRNSYTPYEYRQLVMRYESSYEYPYIDDLIVFVLRSHSSYAGNSESRDAPGGQPGRRVRLSSGPTKQPVGR